MRHLVADHIAASARSQVLLVRPDLRHTSDLQARAQELVKTLRDDDPVVLRSILVGGTITDGSLSLALDGAVLSDRLAIAPGELAPGILSLTMPFTLRRRGVEMKLLAGKPSPAPDPALRTALADAHRWAQALQGGTPLHDIARASGHNEAHIRTRTPLAFLSPRIQRAILEGTQPADLTLERLVRHNLPLDWESQERLCRI